MKRFILFFTLFNIGVNAAWSNHSDILKLCKSMDYQKVEKGLKLLEKNPGRTGQKYEFKTLLNNELCSELWQEMRYIECLESDSINPLDFSISRYKLKMLRHENELIYFRIEQLQEENDKVINFWQDKDVSGMHLLHHTYDSIYHSKLELSDLFQVGFVYGHTCGVNGALPELHKRYQDMMDAQDMEQLELWLKSTVVEKQVYALKGYLELVQERPVIDDELQQIIDVLKRKKGKIMFCQGNRQKLIPIKEAIEPILSQYAAD